MVFLVYNEKINIKIKENYIFAVNFISDRALICIVKDPTLIGQ